MILEEDIIWKAYIGIEKIEGCSYKPENKYYEVVAKEEGTCPSEAINNLDKSIKRPFQYKKINANLLP